MIFNWTLILKLQHFGYMLQWLYMYKPKLQYFIYVEVHQRLLNKHV